MSYKLDGLGYGWRLAAALETPVPIAVAETDPAGSPTNPPESVNPVTKRVDDVIDDLSKRNVGVVDRHRLRGALDKAEKPQEGREGADAGLSNAIRRTGSPFAFVW